MNGNGSGSNGGDQPSVGFFERLGNEFLKHFLPTISVLIGAVLLVVVLFVVANNPYPPGMHRWILLVFGSLSAAGISAFVTGTLKVDGKSPNLNISATGSFAVFIVCMLVGNSWTAASQYVALSAEDIKEQITGKTIVYSTGTHEFHGPDGVVEIFRDQTNRPKDERYQTGQWSVSSDGTRGIIHYTYEKGGKIVTTCMSNILHNAANNGYITHEISGTCGRRGFSVNNENTAHLRYEQWQEHEREKAVQNSEYLTAEQIAALLSNTTIEYRSGTLEYHGPKGELDIARKGRQREQGIWTAVDKDGRGVITYTYQRPEGAVVTCVANIRQKDSDTNPVLVPFDGSCKSASLNIVPGNQLESS